MYVHKYNCKYCGRELQLRCSQPLSGMIYSIFDRNGCCDECGEKLDKEGKNKENIIGFNFQELPIYKITIREILKQLGAIERDGWIGFENNSKILDLFPITLEDDGMAYGVNEQFITLVDVASDKSYINIWREPFHPDTKEKVKEIEDIEKLWKNSK